MPTSDGAFVLKRSSVDARFSAIMEVDAPAGPAPRGCRRLSYGPMLTNYIKLWQQVLPESIWTDRRMPRCCIRAIDRGFPGPNASFIPSC